MCASEARVSGERAAAPTRGTYGQAMSEIKPAASAYHLFQKDKYASVKAALEVSAFIQDLRTKLRGVAQSARILPLVVYVIYAKVAPFGNLEIF